MRSNGFVALGFVLALALGVAAGGCGDEGTGGTGGKGGSGSGGSAGATGAGGSTGSGGANAGSGGGAGSAGNGGNGSAGRGGNGSAGATGAGGRGGFSLDGGLPDAFNLDAILADAGVTTCGAGVSDGSACASGDLACRTTGGSFCLCQGSSWRCF